MPSLYEPFGIAPLEAMLYGLPAIVTNAWALRECVTPGINGDLAEKGNAEDLAAKITQLLSNPDSLATMGRQAGELVLTQYTWPTVAHRIAQTLNAL